MLYIYNDKEFIRRKYDLKLNQPFYIEPRYDSNHLDLNGEWDFFGCDFEYKSVEEIKEGMWNLTTAIPNSIYHSLYKSGIKPDPYVGVNSKLYSDVDEKIWYYRKKFKVDKPDFDGNAFLCFDGVAYYCRVWINKQLIGDHEGMFGGPVVDIISYLNLQGENEIIVEVKACNYRVKDKFNSLHPNGENSQIVPWNIARETDTSTGDFIVLGIWNNVRIEFTEKIHISRPYIYTKSIEDNKAELFIEFEIANGIVNEIRPFYGYYDPQYSYT